MDADDGEQDIIRSFRDLGPAHYVFKIENFSLLRNSAKPIFESSDFEVDGYKWRLSLYPNGQTKRNGNGHISLYLALSESNSLSPDLEVHAECKFFVYNYMKDKYLMIQDAKGQFRRFSGRFHGMKREWGFDKLFPLSTFIDTSNGYLVDDCCIFGVEVSVFKPPNKAECMSVMKIAANGTFTWSIEKFSTLDEDVYISDVFVVGEHRWTLLVYPKGNGKQKDKCLSVFLEWVDEPGSLVRKVFAQYTLLVKNELRGKHVSRKANVEFSPGKSWGFRKFLSLDDLNSESKGFKVNDTLVVEVQFHLMSVLKDF